MFALDRVIAAWLGLAAAVFTTAVTVALAAFRDRGVVLALVMGAVLITVTVLLAIRAHLRRTERCAERRP
ncbi:hypothetical protein ACFHW2_30155 [Actinomadura sp. LOL_016]|uniref:hypothetical protein n=1 Tax=unclassified Actinomadura TaxID=2626254 RepID=UPI003A7FA680